MAEATHITTAEFFGNPVAIIDHANRAWLTAEQAGRCLGYKEATARQSISNLYNKHADEFTDEDTTVIDLMTEAGIREARIYSNTGCNKLGFFARTPRAKDFRTWAAKTLAGVPAVVTPVAAPPAPTSAALEGHMATLAVGMTAMLAQNNVTAKYIELLEMNQVAKRRVTKEIVREVFALKAQGLNQTDIAKLLRVPRVAVKSIIEQRYPGLKDNDPAGERSLDDIMNDWLGREKAKLLASVEG